MKICPKCKALKAEEFFHKCDHNYDGLYSYCMECSRAIRKKHSRQWKCPKCGTSVSVESAMCSSCAGVKRWEDPEYKAKMRIAFKDIWIENGKKRIGAKASNETKLKMSLSRRGSNHYQWKGRRYIDATGYIRIEVPLDCEFSDMATGGRVLEHRLLMAMELGRPLRTDEVVYRKNNNRKDNRIENLFIAERNWKRT